MGVFAKLHCVFEKVQSVGATVHCVPVMMQSVRATVRKRVCYTPSTIIKIIYY